MIALIIISVIIAVILFVPAYIAVEFEKSGKNSKTEIKLKYLIFSADFSKKKDKPEKKKKAKKENKKKSELTLKEKVEKGFGIYNAIEDDISEILYWASEHAITVQNFELLMEIGTDDAMNTGIAVGSAYGTVYNILSLADNIFSVEKCSVNISPDFYREHIDARLKCIFKVKNVHIIIIAFKILKTYFKIRKIK